MEILKKLRQGCTCDVLTLHRIYDKISVGNFTEIIVILHIFVQKGGFVHAGRKKESAGKRFWTN